LVSLTCLQTREGERRGGEGSTGVLRQDELPELGPPLVLHRIRLRLQHMPELAAAASVLLLFHGVTCANWRYLIRAKLSFCCSMHEFLACRSVNAIEEKIELPIFCDKD
jgi:hypothetical protein